MRNHFFFIIITIVLLFSCQSGTELPSFNSLEIRAILDKQVKCWNRGDVECFMQGYWKSDSLKFIGKTGITRGWENTLHRYQKNYPDQATMGTLNFEIIEITPLGTQAAWVVGKFHLRREMGDASGYFTLLFRKIEGEWRIVADHTS